MANENIQELKFQVGEAWKGVYSSSTAYGLANVVQDATGLSIYRSLKSGNVGHPLTDANWWFCIIDMSSIKAESDRIAALNQAIAQDEALRVAAEELRQQKETQREAAETERNEAEQARINAEQQRVTKESQRETKEQQRITAEQGRVTAESARVQAEQARVLAETLRANAEDARAAAETNRAAAEQQRITNEQTRIAQEQQRETKETERQQTFVQSQAARQQAYEQAEAARNTTFNEHEQQRDAEAAALQTKLESGEVIPALADNLASWAGSTQNANYTQEAVVETTGGDLSIDSSVPATLVSIAAKTDFSATKLIATGFNLLRRATAVGNGWYFLVPALPFGTINTASQPNGVLFTNEEHENLRPTVYFKPLASGVPTSVTDGTACAYTDAITGGKSYRFFTTSQAGYIIVSGIDRAATCAHIGWSKRYDEYIAVNDASDAGSEVDIAAGIHALHSYDKMLTVGNVADRIEKTGDNQITWHRLVDHVQPTWTNTSVESEGEPTGDYIHTATISGMKTGGAAAFETLGITLIVDGTTISFTDQNETVENDYVKYELATEATGTASVSSSFTVEDWGLIIIQGAVGSAYINIAYAQGIPDSVRQMLSNIDNKTIPVIAEALLYLYNENKALRELLAGKDNAVLPVMKAQNVECDDILTLGVPNVLYSGVAGAPSAANVPDNWNEETMTVWDGCPRKIGQQYVDKVNKKVYYAVDVTGSTNDWVALN